MTSRWTPAATLMVATWLAAAPAHAGPQAVDQLIDQGERLCRQGALQQAADQLRRAHQQAGTPAQKAAAAAALGLALHRMRRFQEAEPLLREAHDQATGPAERALRANDLANTLLGLRRPDDARRLYDEAHRLAPADAALQLSVRLNQARLAPAEARPAALREAAALLPGLADPLERARHAAHLGTQALALGAPGRRLAFEALDQARRLTDPLAGTAPGAAAATPAGTASGTSDATRLQAEVLDALAQLYENDGRADDALRLTDEAVARAQAPAASPPAATAPDPRDLLFRLEWRRGRLLKAAGARAPALAAYRRAVEHIEAVRQDIPIEYEEGRSSFRETLEPIYLALAELLLDQAQAAAAGPEGAAAPAAQQAMREARDVVELVKRSELDDFLGERCTVESARTAGSTLPAGTAVLYPIVFPDRLEMLLETAQGLRRHTQPLPAADLQRLVLRLAETLRRRGGYADTARTLHQHLLQPLEPLLQAGGTHTLVVVPDGVLRLLPYGALFDGRHFAIEKYAVVTAPALSLTRAATPAGAPPRLLLAGLAEPGPVVDKLPKWVLDMLTGTPTRTLTRDQTVQALALPGVREEVQRLRGHLGGQLPTDVLLDADFTLQRFGERFATGRYSVVHIASHGVFSSSAAESFLLTHDGLLTIDGLQRLLRSEPLRRRPIELLALSACQTAEGDDRAPLGLSGAALKARAGAALGTLWPVSDEAAMELMSRFYARLADTPEGKARALQHAQRALLAEPRYRHPFYWAAFILVGSWQ